MDWSKLIPARGEAEVMAKLKGGYGSKAMRSRSGGRSRRSSKFSRLRQTPKGREADWVIPLAPGHNPTQSQGDQLHMEWQTPQNTSGTISRWWQFVVHPGLRPAAGTTPVLPWVAGLEENSESARYRLQGFSGDVYWSPLQSSDEEITPPMCSGFVAGAWYKLQRSNAIDIEADGTTVVNPTFRAQFPFRALSTLDSTRMADEVAGYGVPYPLNGNADYVEDGQLVHEDWRLVEHAKPIGMFCKPWYTDFVSPIFGFDDVGQPVTVSQIAQMGPAHAVRIPLPRKLVCNVGRNEALALYMMAWCGVGSSYKAPYGTLTYPTFRAKLLELD